MMSRKSIGLLVTAAILAVPLPILAATGLDSALQGGKVISPLTSPANGVSSGNSVAVQSDGKISAGGFGRGPNITGIAIRRFNADGAIDSASGNLGSILELSSGPSFFNSYGNEMELQSDGKIVMAGYIDSNNLFRF
ncbi:MAG: hypothetical protein JSS81_19655 [Acidobacteria bacterium]|nr:hypothetical protein [Acidobacteriota bacterium]